MKTTHLFKHDKQYYAKSSVESASVRYEYSFEDKPQQELYPWYNYMIKDSRHLGWMSARHMAYHNREDQTIGGWEDGPSGRYPVKMMMDFRQLKVDSVTIVVRLKNGHSLEYDVSNKEDKLMEGYNDRKMNYDATSSTGCRIYGETENEIVSYHFQAKYNRIGTNPSLIMMEEPLDQSYTRFDVMIDDAVDLYELERTTLDKLVEQYAQEKLDNFVESNL